MSLVLARAVGATCLPLSKHPLSIPFVYLALVLAVAGCAASVRAAPAPAQSNPRTDESIDDVVHSELLRARTPGAVVAVVANDTIAFLRAYGVANHETDTPLEANALFRVSVVPELLTGLTAAGLQAEGRLTLTAPIGGVVEELPRALGDITLEQLLTHTAGLAAVPAVPGRGGEDDLGAAARQLTYLDAFTEPGSIYSRSEPGAALAGYVIERAAGAPYADVVHSAVLQPLGMTQSTFDFAQARAAGLVPGHRPSQTADRPLHVEWPEPDSALATPLRGLYASAPDLARLVLALVNAGAVDGAPRLPAEVVENALRPRVLVPTGRTAVGLGVRLGDWAGRPEIRFVGSSGGHGALIRVLPNEGVAVIVLTNGSGVLGRVPDFVFQRLLEISDPGHTAPDEPTSAPGPDRLARLAGTYANGGEVLVLELHDGELRLRSGDIVRAVRPRQPRGYEAFLPDGRVALTFDFVEGATGRPYLWVGNRALARRDEDGDTSGPDHP